MAQRRILIEATKLAMGGMDGNKRYVLELLGGLLTRVELGTIDWQIDVYVGGHSIVPLQIPRLLEDAAHSRPRQAGGKTFKAVLLNSADRAYCRGRDSLAGTAQSMLPDVVYSSLIQWKRRLFGRRTRRAFGADGGDMASRLAIPFPLGKGYDLVHLTLPTAYYPFRETSTAMITTVHDLCHLRMPDSMERRNRVALSRGLKQLVRRDSHFITVSEATRRDLSVAYSLDASRIRTIPEACNTERFRPVRDAALLEEVRRRYHLPTGPYLLSLCTLEPRKNVVQMVRAFNQLLLAQPEVNTSLILAGPKGWKVSELFRDSGLKRNQVHLTGFVDDADLPVLYSGALGFVYVSHYEGFGLPLLESMSCGTPVIFGDNSSMPEVVGPGGLPARSGDVRHIMEQMRRLIQDAALRRTLAGRALARAAEFSWERTIDGTVAEYDRRFTASR